MNGSERRQKPRYDINIIGQIIIERTKEPGKIFLTRDISGNGLQFISNTELDIGEKVIVKIKLPKIKNEFASKAVTIWQKKYNENQYLYGIRLDDEHKTKYLDEVLSKLAR